MKFKTKADTLKQLEGVLTKGSVLPQVTFKVEEYDKNKENILSKIDDLFKNIPLIVRSSAISEDCIDQSNAGKYLSIANINGKNELKNSIQDVIESFIDNDTQNQVLVQPMLEQITMSGVLFTTDPQTKSKYFVINYDDDTGSTDSVTSGLGEQLKICYIVEGNKSEDCKINQVVSLAKELIELFSHEHLDIEFAFSKDELYLLQVRPLIITNYVDNKTQQNECLEEISKYIKKSMQKKPYLFGDDTVYGVMPDWNPAEIIGLRPKPLAMSLYKYLVTDGVWAYQRDNYGYKNLRSYPLLIDFCGLPYIDTRVSFNSFIPKLLNKELSDKLVNYYITKLKNNPQDQDKIEFNIILSCFTFDIDDKLNILLDEGFTENECAEIRNSLRDLTNNIIDIREGLWKKDFAKIEKLKVRLETVKDSENLDIIEKIYWLLEDCCRYGTLPFAGLARAGFISVSLLKSLISIGIINQAEYDNFMTSLNTVSSQMADDSINLSKVGFLNKYGHLRPGTYDILSPRYDENPELYFNDNSNSKEKSTHDEFKLSLSQYQNIQEIMDNNSFGSDVLSLFEFIKTGIEEREYSKFVFTKSLSEVIKLIGELGSNYGFTKEDMSYFDVNEIYNIYSSSCDVKEIISKSIEKGKLKYNQTLSITLPPVITCENDIFCFYTTNVTPNYITQKNTSGTIVFEDLNKDTIKDKIVLITSADPGYDWIFAHDIKGFITAFGGVNSHMAIRANELSIPAVIGIGQQKFDEIKKHSLININCANKKMEILK